MYFSVQGLPVLWFLFTLLRSSILGEIVPKWGPRPGVQLEIPARLPQHSLRDSGANGRRPMPGTEVVPDVARSQFYPAKNIAMAAAAITAAASHPTNLSSGGFTTSHLKERGVVSSTTSTISAGASTPLATADQKSIFTAFRPT